MVSAHFRALGDAMGWRDFRDLLAELFR